MLHILSLPFGASAASVSVEVSINASLRCSGGISQLQEWPRFVSLCSGHSWRITNADYPAVVATNAAEAAASTITPSRVQTHADEHLRRSHRGTVSLRHFVL